MVGDSTLLACHPCAAQQGHPIDAVDQNQQTPLFRAAEAGRYEAPSGEWIVAMDAPTIHFPNDGFAWEELEELKKLDVFWQRTQP